MPLAIVEPFRLIYQSGNEYDMGDTFGLIVLVIDNAFQLAIDQRARNGQIVNHWNGTTDRAVVERLLGHLDAAGYPKVPDHRIPAGARLRSIAIESAGESTHTYPTEWEAVDHMPGYSEAYQILDTMIMQTTSGKLKMTIEPFPGGVGRPA
jgi:hypothetical protein